MMIQRVCMVARMKRWIGLLLALSMIALLVGCRSSNMMYTISFHTNGGTLVDSIPTDGRTIITFPDHPEKEGYLFGGWYWDNETFLEPFTERSLLERPLSTNLMVYAKWIERFSELEAFLIATNTTSFIIMQNGIELYSYYQYPMLKNYPVNIASAGKSMASIVFGIAIDQGYFSLDDKISTYIDDIQSITRDELDKITVRQLLTMTSGLDDLLNMSYPNGQGWEYSDAWNLMFNILESTTQQSVDEYSKENLFDKIGMNNTEFRDSTKTLMQLRDAKPIFSDWKPRQVFTTSNDFVKFGQLILNHGVYQGQQIISNSYLIQALSDCKENPAYGFLFWLNEKNGAIAAGTGEIIETNIIPNAPKDTVAALGMGDKKLYIVPSLNLTIARHGSAAYGEHFAFTIYDHELWYYINKCLGT